MTNEKRGANASLPELNSCCKFHQGQYVKLFDVVSGAVKFADDIDKSHPKMSAYLKRKSFNFQLDYADCDEIRTIYGGVK